MERRSISLRVVAGFAVLVAALATPGQAAPRSGERVSIVGCPYAGMTASCLMVRTKDGTLYNISALSPRPRRSDRMIRVRGVVTDKFGICGEGIVLDRIRWTRTRLRCPQ